MGRVAVIGEDLLVTGYALAGAVVVPAEGDDAVQSAWNHLAPDIEVVVLTARAADALGQARVSAGAPLTVVMPS